MVMEQKLLKIFLVKLKSMFMLDDEQLNSIMSESKMVIAERANLLQEHKALEISRQVINSM